MKVADLNKKFWKTIARRRKVMGFTYTRRNGVLKIKRSYSAPLVKLYSGLSFSSLTEALGNMYKNAPGKH